MKQTIIISIIIFFTLLGSAYSADSGNEYKNTGSLDDVLEGFDDSDTVENSADDLESLLGGFDDFDPAPTDEFLENKFENKSEIFELSGSLSLGASYGFAHDAPNPGSADYRGLSRFRPDLHLALDINLPKKWKMLISGRAFYDVAYMIHGRDQYSSETLSEYEKEAEFQEVYLQGSLFDDLDIKAGRQIVVWGKSDNIRVTDVLNPLDMREPGIIDIEDLRLPLFMTKLDYYKGSWSLTGIAIHETRFNKTPVPGSEFFPSEGIALPELEPSEGLDNMEYAFALNGIFSGWDMSLYFARVFNDEGHVEMIAPFVLELRHSRISMFGAAGNIAFGNWLLKSEVAYIDGLRFFNMPGGEKSRLDLLVGAEYSGFKDTMISFEVANRHILEFDNNLELLPDYSNEDEFQAVLRYNCDFYHDRLHVVAILSMFGLTGDDGSFQRVSTEYDFSDNVSITLGAVTYQSGDLAKYSEMGDKDRLFFEYKYSF